MKVSQNQSLLKMSPRHLPIVVALVLVLLLLDHPGFASGYGGDLCPDKCICDDIHLQVKCIHAGMEYMPNTLNPGLETIIYRFNNFETIDVSIRFLPSLKKVDLSHNKILSVPNKTFESQTRLKELRLDNNKISAINNYTFKGLHQLQYLGFKANLVEELHENLFTFTPKLEEIDLSRNRINKIHPNAFAGLNSLKILNLGDNLLTSIPTAALEPLAGLAELTLSGNAISAIPPNSLDVFLSLAYLDMSSCRISTPRLSLESFRGLGTLRKLKLNGNNLTAVPTEAFATLPRLEELAIGQNPFREIPGNAFVHLQKLKILSISGCAQLRKIHSNAFKQCVDLEKLVLSMNRQLTDIAPDAFDSNSVLKHVNMADNGLKTISEYMLPWNQLKQLDFSGNPWHCNCDIYFLQPILFNLKQNQTLQRSTWAKCNTPKDLQYKALYNLKQSDIDSKECNRISAHSSSKSRRQNYTGVTASQNNSLENDSNTIAVIISVCIVSVVLVASLVIFVLYRCHPAIRDFCDNYKWRKHDDAITRKQEHFYHHEYRKQPLHDEDYYIQIAQHVQTRTNGRAIPVTEL